MKKLSMITSIAIIANFGLIGCGGGSSASTDTSSTNSTLTTTNPSSVSIQGTAIDPELKDALICLDINRDENCTSEEPTTWTDENGNFKLDISEEQLQGDYPLLAIGGKDKATGDDFAGKLLADIQDNTQNITPLTTLAYRQLQNSADKYNSTTAMEKLETILGLSFDEIQENIVTLANEGNTKGMQIALTLQKSAEALMPEDPLAFYDALAQKIKEANPADTLSELILSITPDDDDLKEKMSTFVKETMTTSLEDAYAMAGEAKDNALAGGLDISSRMIAMENGNTFMSENNTSSNEGTQIPGSSPINPTKDSNTSNPNTPINPTGQGEVTSPKTPTIPSNTTNPTGF
jgi:hypothetical protein